MDLSHEPTQAIAHAREDRIQLRTARGQVRFLAAFRDTCNIRLAAELAQVGRRTVYLWLKQPPFKARYDDAQQDAVDKLEAAAWTRAVDGVDEPVFQKGAEVGKIRKYSDVLTVALLRAHRPEKYRESESSGKGGITVLIGAQDSAVQVNIGAELPPLAVPVRGR